MGDELFDRSRLEMEVAALFCPPPLSEADRLRVLGAWAEVAARGFPHEAVFLGESVVVVGPVGRDYPKMGKHAPCGRTYEDLREQRGQVMCRRISDGYQFITLAQMLVYGHET